jgi:hypothetical protein
LVQTFTSSIKELLKRPSVGKNFEQRRNIDPVIITNKKAIPIPDDPRDSGICLILYVELMLKDELIEGPSNEIWKVRIRLHRQLELLRTFSCPQRKIVYKPVSKKDLPNKYRDWFSRDV